MDYILGLMGKVPTVLWIIIGLVFVVPLLWRAFKTGAKILGWVAVFLALLFIFPSIGSSFMNEAQLTWDEETGTLTNRNGTSISVNDIIEKGSEVKDMTKDALDNAGDIMDIIGSKNDYDSGTASKIKSYDVTPEVIKKAAAFGMALTDDMIIVNDNGSWYVNLGNGNKLTLTNDIVRALGILNSN